MYSILRKKTWGKDRQGCPSDSSLAGNKYTYLLADTSQQEVPTVSNISLFPLLFVFRQPHLSLHPLPLGSARSKCKHKAFPNCSVESIVKSALQFERLWFVQALLRSVLLSRYKTHPGLCLSLILKLLVLFSALTERRLSFSVVVKERERDWMPRLQKMKL